MGLTTKKAQGRLGNKLQSHVTNRLFRAHKDVAASISETPESTHGKPSHVTRIGRISKAAPGPIEGTGNARVSKQRQGPH